MSLLRSWNRPLQVCMAILACAWLAVAPQAFGQVTTGSLTGVVSAADGSALPGVTIEAVHVPTGTRYSDVTSGNGRFTIPNVRVGGPYRVTAALEGFRNASADQVMVPLGAAAEVPLTLQLATVSEAITVTASAEEVINPNRQGATSTVSEEAIETLPTVNRTLQDFARTNPYVNVDPQDTSSTRMTIAGKNNRYNSIAIDGAVNNDLFGLADTGTPGGQADALPISLDAIQQIQVAVSPVDVRQGGFTGGGINAVTRSGTNQFEGSAFYSKRDASFVGDGPFDNPVREFDSEQYGGRLGGPIFKDRLFFFVNGEKNKRSEQGDYSGDGSVPGGNSFRGGTVVKPEDLAGIAAFLQSRFSYDAGTLGDIPEQRYSNNFFGRADWNIGSAHQLTLRHNYVEAQRDVISDRTSTRFRFPTATYAFADETNSTVAQLNSTFGGNAYNEARVNLTTIRDKRAVPVAFPGIEIGGTGPRNADVLAGTEQFSGANGLDQDILEITNDFTFMTGNHTITIGTHNEFFDFKNLFMSSAYGHYYFPTLADFYALTPSQYFVTFANPALTDDRRNPTTFGVAQYGVYASDSVTLANNVTLAFGARLDMPQFDRQPTYNHSVFQAIGYNTTNVASEDVVISPRFGVNWRVTDKSQLRASVGSFAGRTPYVWISNSYGNTGVEQISLTCAKPNCTPTFVADPNAQPTNFAAGGGAFEVNLTDPNFQLPRLLRTTVGYDHQLPWGINATAEATWSKTLEDVYYWNVNYVPSGVSALDGRPTYRRLSTVVSNALYLTNTSKGRQRIATLQLNKNFGRMVNLSTSYTNQDAQSAFDGGSSTALSQWRFHHTRGNIYEPELSRSAYETTHRFNLSGTLNFNTAMFSHAVGLYWNAQSGRPYSMLFATDINGDGQNTNDLLFVPNNMILCPSTARTPAAGAPCGTTTTGVVIEPLDANKFYTFMSSVGFDDKGRIMERYELSEPWTRQLDLHYELGLPAFRDIRTMLTADVNNVLAIIDKEYGNVRYVANQNTSPVAYQGIDAASGLPIYRERVSGSTNPGSQFSTAVDRSRWQARLGVRVSF